MGLDIGSKTVTDFTNAINTANTIVWNGPMGVFEFPNFAKGTVSIAKAIADRTQKAGAISIIGGADGPTSIFLAGKLGQTPSRSLTSPLEVVPLLRSSRASSFPVSLLLLMLKRVV